MTVVMYVTPTIGQNIVEVKLWKWTVHHKNKGITEFANAVTARVHVDLVLKGNIVRIRVRQLAGRVKNVDLQIIFSTKIVHQRPTPCALVVLQIPTCRLVMSLQESVIATLGMK